MDIVARFAVEIARQVAPNEVYEAPLIAAIYVKGGRQRKRLLKRSRSSESGGVGVVEASLLPLFLHALGLAAPFLLGLLTAKTVTNADSIACAIRSALNATPQNSPFEVADYSLKQLQPCTDMLTTHLEKKGFSQEESKHIAHQLILILWENAPDAIDFLKKITEKE